MAFQDSFTLVRLIDRRDNATMKEENYRVSTNHSLASVSRHALVASAGREVVGAISEWRQLDQRKLL